MISPIPKFVIYSKVILSICVFLWEWIKNNPTYITYIFLKKFIQYSKH